MLLKAVIFFQVATFIIVDVNLELARHPISVAAVAKPVLVQIHPTGTANLTFVDRYSPWWNAVRSWGGPCDALGSHDRLNCHPPIVEDYTIGV